MSLYARRAFLKFLAASPVLAGFEPLTRVYAQSATDPRALASATEALDVFDMEAAARRLLPPAHWGYLQSGVDGEATLRANAAGYTRYQLKARRFVDVSHMDLSTEVLGTKMNSPVVLSPIGSLRAMNPAGEVGVARAAKTRGALQMLSTQASFGVEDVTEARGAPIWFQLYTTNQFEATKKLLKRAEAAGCPVVLVTVDTPAGRNTVTAARLRREDTRNCSVCHSVDDRGNPRAGMGTKPMFAGLDLQNLGLTSPSLTWDFVGRMKDSTRMKVVIKGLETREDAELAVKHGADGIMVSNHGGRSIESGRGTIESLPEVVAGARGRIPVLVDGGVRRGTDVYKALALGASAVGIGRPYAWGLAAFGQEGAERVLDILNLELRLAMVGCGARSVREITTSTLIDTQPLHT
jgi:isopentenyl diphosphate isomerase/L-lactate dehydrogenase-like FMN-dependent dehydrogenase